DRGLLRQRQFRSARDRRPGGDWARRRALRGIMVGLERRFGASGGDRNGAKVIKQHACYCMLSSTHAAAQRLATKQRMTDVATNRSARARASSTIDNRQA